MAEPAPRRGPHGVGPDVATGGPPSPDGLLMAFIWVNLTSALAATALLVIHAALLVHSWWYAPLLAAVGGGAAGLVYARSLARRGRRVAAVLVVMAADWVAALVATFVSPQTTLATGTPLVGATGVLLAAAYVPWRRLVPLALAAVATTTVLAWVGATQPGVGIEAMTPPWANRVTAVAFLPAVLAEVVVLVWQNHLRLSWELAAQARSRERLVAAQDETRRRFERDLRDGAQRQLATAADRLRAVRAQVSAPRSAAGVGRGLDSVRQTLEEAVAELRRFAQGVYPAPLDSRGLADTLRAHAAGSPLRTRVEAVGLERWPTEIEANVYFCCIEGLQNARKHAGPDTEVTVRLDGRRGLSFEVSDTGTGFDPTQPCERHGLVDLADRLGAVGGRLEVDSEPGAGTTLRGHVPAPDPPERRRGFRRLLERWAGGGTRSTGNEAAYRAVAVVLLAEWAVIVLVELGIFLGAAREPVLLVMAALTLADGAGFVVLRRLNRTTLVNAPLWYAAVSWWVYAVVSVWLFPTAVCSAVVGALIPVVLGVPLLGRRGLAVMISTTLAVELLLAVLGQLGTGIELVQPAWLRPTSQVVFIATGAAAIVITALLDHVRLSWQVELLTRSQRRLVAAQDASRRQLERDLHDGAQQQVVAAAVQLGVARALVERDPAAFATKLGEVLTDLDAAVGQLQGTAGGLYPAHLADEGLAGALRALVSRSPQRTRVEAVDLGRWPAEIEASVYFCCVEALQNALKHAGPDAEVTVRLDGRRGLSFEVSDTGTGFDPTVPAGGHGLANLADRLGAVQGHLEIDSRPGTGTRIRGHLPPGAHRGAGADGTTRS